jgi:hypothetical protein
MKRAGITADAFRFALIEEAAESVRIIELTYMPTGVTRWYDVRSPGWSTAAVQDFGLGKFV